MSDGFSSPGTEAPTVLPAVFVLAVLAVRAVRVAGAQPVAAVVLVEITTKGMA